MTSKSPIYVGICESSGKKSYVKRAQARTAISDCRARGLDVSCEYKCPECRHWHITKIRRQEWQSIDKAKAKRKAIGKLGP